MAQDSSKGEVFGGYQFMHLSESGTSINANGFDFAGTGKFTKDIGFTADISGAYKTISGASGHVYTYTFGPTYYVSPKETVSPFVHVLFGGTSVGGSVSGGGSGSTSGFAMYIGGGVDAKVKKNIAIRVAQFDWLHYSVNGVSGSSNVRLCFGAVFRF
jgi:hypothetical protein